MGLLVLAKMYRLENATLKTLPESAGPAVVAVGSFGDDAIQAEVWGVPGVWSMLPDNTHGVRLPMGGERFGAIVATHHYKTPRPTLAKGETAVGSTSSDGLLVKAKTVYRADGTQEINGTGKFFVTHAELDTALQSFVTALNAVFATKLDGAGSPGTLVLNITLAKTTTVKTGG